MQSSPYLPRALPADLQDLATLALDLRWSWNHGADALWREIDPDSWEATRNPWLILQTLSDQRLQTLAADERIVQMLREQLDAREQHYRSQTWFCSEYADRLNGSVAYFSMEFGLSESLPIYSGGLGVLAGDFLKTACDLDVPIFGLGLLYQQGYFRQAIDSHGEQLEFYPFNDPSMLPVTPLRNDKGEWLRVEIELPGRAVRLRTWQVQVGRRSLFLLDSNDPLNAPGDRAITSELYGGGPELRLQQEIVLGIGGWRLLEGLGLDCSVCHINEGHAAFAILERARQYMVRTGLDFYTALRATRAGNLFTTHTPLAAGFDRFAPELFTVYFHAYARALGLSLDELLALGRASAQDDTEAFNTAYLAMRGAGAVNAVSRLHGEVSRRMFAPLFPRWPPQQVPIGHVTNGVHVPSWDSAAADALWTQACGQARWRGAVESIDSDLRTQSDEALWTLRSQARSALIDFLHGRLRRQQRGPDDRARQLGGSGELLDPDVLTVGFARRFAEYKRTNLLLHKPERLLKLLLERDRPIQLVIAGKAHPNDAQGKQMIREWQELLAQPEVRGRAVFVQDYDLVVAEALTQGVDVWINTPRQPWEACGTSGMKVLVNGGLNLSSLDGWWAEAYTTVLGWALGDDHARGMDTAEVEQLYRILENEVVPCFYNRDHAGLPRSWIARMRQSMCRLTSRFSTNRMIRDYIDDYYLPLAAAVQQRSTDTAAELEHWHRQLEQHWQQIRFGTLTATPIAGGHSFEIQIYLDGLSADAVRVELYAEPTDDGMTFCQTLIPAAPVGGAANAYLYQANVTTDRPASDFTPRVVPFHPAALVPLETNLIAWYR